VVSLFSSSFLGRGASRLPRQEMGRVFSKKGRSRGGFPLNVKSSGSERILAIPNSGSLCARGCIGMEGIWKTKGRKGENQCSCEGNMGEHEKANGMEKRKAKRKK